MQKKNTVETLHHIKGFSYMKSINARLIGLLCILFLFQHFSFATLQNTFGFDHLSSGTVSNSFFETGPMDHRNHQVDLYVESEPEDEDEMHHAPVYLKGQLSNLLSFKSGHYTACINTLYLSLTSDRLRKVELPYFVLYHSWKSHLS